VRFVPRFAADHDAADSFSFQWNRFRRTQLDSHSGLPISRDRFAATTGWSDAALSGASVLDMGCGAGRFAEVALAAGSVVTAVDYSGAVDSCRDNLGPHPRLDVVQADVYRLPFEPHGFDFVYCLGVLSLTPDVAGAFRALVGQVREGGKIAVDVYPRLWLNALWPKYWLRRITRRMPRERLYRMVEWMVKWLLPVSLVLGRIPVVGRKLRYAIPVMNHEPDFPLTADQVREWALLDTYDMLAPTQDQPQSASTLETWFRDAGVRDVEILRKGFLIGRGSLASRRESVGTG
jgi:SAM-dependent methyltransferase